MPFIGFTSKVKICTLYGIDYITQLLLTGQNKSTSQRYLLKDYSNIEV